MDLLEEQIMTELAKSQEIGLVFLFGSCATGRQTASSDLDLAIASAQPISTQTRMDLIDNLANTVRRPIDLIDMEHAGPVLLKEILTKGKLLYCQNIDLKVKFITRLWDLEADFMPSFRQAQRERLEVFSHG